MYYAQVCTVSTPNSPQLNRWPRNYVAGSVRISPAPQSESGMDVPTALYYHMQLANQFATSYQERFGGHTARRCLEGWEGAEVQT